jgi:protein-L-isoaspartate(D-aspartate) O-methyltransferase
MKRNYSDIDTEYYRKRLAMVLDQIASRGIKDQRVLAAMRTVPRHRFVEPSQADEAYTDGPLPIGYGQTISQPYIVASMTERLALRSTDRVLEIGTGSGYQTAVLAELAGAVFSIERIAGLQQQAAGTLHEIGYDTLHLKVGDGSLGWPEAAPFDAIMVTAAAEHIPDALVEQLAVGGRLILPLVLERGQQLILLRRTEQGLERSDLYGVRFVPLVKDQ